MGNLVPRAFSLKNGKPIFKAKALGTRLAMWGIGRRDGYRKREQTGRVKGVDHSPRSNESNWQKLSKVLVTLTVRQSNLFNTDTKRNRTNCRLYRGVCIIEAGNV